jgi:hypothetical protein
MHDMRLAKARFGNPTLLFPLYFLGQRIHTLTVNAVCCLASSVFLDVNLLNHAVPSKFILDLARLDAFQCCKQLDEDWAWLFGIGRDVGERLVAGVSGYRLDRNKSSCCTGSEDFAEAWELFVFDLESQP